jgi:hypothetical protein
MKYRLGLDISCDCLEGGVRCRKDAMIITNGVCMCEVHWVQEKKERDERDKEKHPG